MESSPGTPLTTSQKMNAVISLSVVGAAGLIFYFGKKLVDAEKSAHIRRLKSDYPYYLKHKRKQFERKGAVGRKVYNV